MNAGIKSCQGRIDKLYNNINQQYRKINENLERFDKINDVILDELKKIQAKDVYGLIAEEEYSQCLGKNISALLCTYLILQLEKDMNPYQYEYFKGCCVKIQNFATIDDITEGEVLLELSELCDKTQAEIVVKLISIFYAIEDDDKVEVFLNSDELDEFLISNKKIRDIKAYIQEMLDIYGDKICFIYGHVEEEKFRYLMEENEIISPEEMYNHGLELVCTQKSKGIEWIMKAAEKEYEEAINYLKNNYLTEVYLIGCRNKKAYYVSKEQLRNDVMKVYRLNGDMNTSLIYENGRLNKSVVMLDDTCCFENYIAFVIYQPDYRAYLFSINVYTDECKEIDSWRIDSNQSPFIKLKRGRIFYGNLEFDITRIRNRDTITDYLIDFDGKNKEEIYR